mmetsp:Transcript_46330/g.148791  ORF Transcript_46330/g.148791 Transcript_46330/m.148791 type:complete len:257 (+) Transcript_46330:111-881(+)
MHPPLSPMRSCTDTSAPGRRMSSPCPLRSSPPSALRWTCGPAPSLWSRPRSCGCFAGSGMRGRRPAHCRCSSACASKAWRSTRFSPVPRSTLACELLSGSGPCRCWVTWRFNRRTWTPPPTMRPSPLVERLERGGRPCRCWMRWRIVAWSWTPSLTMRRSAPATSQTPDGPRRCSSSLRWRSAAWRRTSPLATRRSAFARRARRGQWPPRSCTRWRTAASSRTPPRWAPPSPPARRAWSGGRRCGCSSRWASAASR